MVKKIRNILFRLKSASASRSLFNPGKEGYAELIQKMNNYFLSHPEEGLKFLDEMDFMNNQVELLPVRDRLLYAIMPYPFVLPYDYSTVPVYRDEEAGMFFVFLEGKKLYYHKGFTTMEAVQKSFTYISAEQHPDSPHRYLDDIFFVQPGEVVADFGAAEGNFSLMVVEQAKKIYIVEAEEIWLEALKKTFDPWQEKVVIINKWIGDIVDYQTTTIGDLFGNNPPDVIKMDIEGAEWKVINEAQDMLSKKNIRLAITTYHQHDDASNIKILLERLGYETFFSEKFILFVYDVLRPPYFRKGLIKTVIR